MPPALFEDVVARWHDFYILSGTVAATLMGLLFVSLSLHVETLRRDPQSRLERIARTAFTSFLIVVFIALLMLSPEVRRRPLASALIGLGLLRLFIVLPGPRHPWPQTPTPARVFLEKRLSGRSE